MALDLRELATAEFKRDPFPTLATLREMGPIVRGKLPLIGECWVTTNFQAANWVLRDKECFGVDPRNAGRRTYAGLQWWMPRVLRSLTSNMLGKDAPDHRRLRGLVESAFLRQSIEGMRPRIEQLVEHQLDQLVEATRENGGADFITHFARPFPLAVISELLGLPERDRPNFLRWADTSNVSSNPLSMLTAFRGMTKLSTYLKRQFELCRKDPRPGMISALVAVEQQGERLSEEELLAAAFVLLIAGHETTVHLLVGSVLTLLQHPQQKAELMTNWSLAGCAVDEVLRYTSPVQMTKPRYARRNVEMYGARIARGDIVVALLAAANADPAQFQSPEKFDIHRDPNNHLAFGTGIHVCLGLKLAKAETEISLEKLLRRFPHLELGVSPEQLKWTKRLGMRSARQLPIQLNSPDSKPADAAA